MLKNTKRFIISYMVFQMFIQELNLDGTPACPLVLVRVILEDVVHLFESAALGLRNEEIGPDTGEDTEDGEEDIGAVSCVFNQGRSDETNNKVVEPVGAS